MSSDSNTNAIYIEWTNPTTCVPNGTKAAHIGPFPTLADASNILDEINDLNAGTIADAIIINTTLAPEDLPGLHFPVDDDFLTSSRIDFALNAAADKAHSG